MTRARSFSKSQGRLRGHGSEVLSNYFEDLRKKSGKSRRRDVSTVPWAAIQIVASTKMKIP